MLVPEIKVQNIYLLNVTDLTKWNDFVCSRAMEISTEFY